MLETSKSLEMCTTHLSNPWGNFYPRTCSSIRVLTVFFILVIYLTPSPTGAITINMAFDAVNSDSPSFDPGATLLQGMANEAAQIWEDIFEESDSITITYGYDSIGSLASGGASSVSGGQPTAGNITIDSDNRTWYFDPTPLDNSEYDMTQRLYRDLTETEQLNWYDSTPPNLLEVSYRGDANSGAPANAQNGFDMFSTFIHEIGHVLGLSHTQMAKAESVDEGDFDFDVDSVLAGGNFFEIETAGIDGTNVNHWAHIAAQSLMCNGCAESGLRRLPSATDVFAIQSAAGWNTSLIDLPRQDFMGYDSGNDWNTDANWEGNQVPGAADDAFVRKQQSGNPGGNSNAAILSANGRVENLTISYQGNVDTQEFQLVVDDTLTVADTNSDLFVGNESGGGEVEADILNVIDNAELHSGAGSLIDVNHLNISTNSLLVGEGTIAVQTELENDGTITAGSGGIAGAGGITEGGTLTLTTSSAAGAFDLDGFTITGEMMVIMNEPGIVNATLGDIVVDGSLTDGFNGTMNVSSGHKITFNEDWELSAASFPDVLINGELNLTEGTIAGNGTMSAQGILHVHGGTTTGISSINSPVDFGSNVDVNINVDAELEVNGAATVNGGNYNIDDGGLMDFDSTLSIGNATFNDIGSAGTADVRFDGATTYTGGTINASAPINQGGDATVTGTTVINAETINLDGDGSTTITLNNDLTLNVDAIEHGGVQFDGTLKINGAFSELEVNTVSPWVMDGTLVITTGTENTYASMSGQDFTLSGPANVTGGTRFDARVDIDSSGSINFQTNTSRLSLYGGDLVNTNTISGGSVNGPTGSNLRSTGASALVGYGNINTNVDFLTGTALLADNGTLTIDGSFISLGQIGTNDADGTLNVVNSWNTSTADELRLNGGAVTGSGITNDNLTIGYGSITTSSFHNDSILTADGGTLTLDTGTYPDLDGGTETGIVNAVLGSVDVLTSRSSNFLFDGTINIGPGQSFRSNSGGVTNSGVVNITNGTFETSSFKHKNQLNVYAGGTSRLESPTINFENGSTSIVDDDLEISGAADIFAGATFTGSGSLVVTPGSQLNLKDGASVGIDIDNNGKIEVGSSPGTATIETYYRQSAVAILESEIDGTTVGSEYDQLIVSGLATLNGILNMPVNDSGGTYGDPTIRGNSDTFVLVNAGLRSGVFNTVTYDGSVLVPDFVSGDDFRDHIGTGLFRNMMYTSTEATLTNYLALEGDADGDGSVGPADFAILASHWLTSVTGGWIQGDFDGSGYVDPTDFSMLAANWLTSAGSSTAITAIPEPSTLALTGLGLLTTLTGLRFRRCGRQSA